MQQSNLQHNEIDRISVLHEIKILDTPAESVFDAITAATAKLCDMPLSFVCLVDTERVWFKSSMGIEGIDEIPREIGFCPYTIMQEGVFEVKDATIDNRFSSNPMVT